MMFAERNGFEDHKTRQITSIDERLRNRLYNWLTEVSRNFPEGYKNIAYIVDRLGEANMSYERNVQIILIRFYCQSPQSKWYDPYTIMELFLEFQRKQFGCANCSMDSCPNDYCRDSEFFSIFTERVNSILEDENSGYRLMDDVFVPITNTSELDSIQKASEINFESVRKHINKAIRSLSDKATPDYENSIKDAISAVEAMCCIITGLEGKNATLGKALQELGKHGVRIHEKMKEAFQALYHYCSNEGGIRHGATTFPEAGLEDAQYMLVTCSAFVNYLNSKFEKAKLENNQNEQDEL